MTEHIIDEQYEGVIIAEDVPFSEFMAQFEGQPVEWHAGKVIQLEMSNNEVHQSILSFLHFLFKYFLAAKKLGRIYFDGYQMYISDDMPARQPDLVIVLKEHYDRITYGHLNGAADIVVEIVSPESSKRDRGAKFHEYEAAGVPEYWLIDPIRKEAYVYHLNDEGNYNTISSSMSESKLLISSVLKGFQLSSDILWRDELPEDEELIEMVQAMGENAS